MEVVNRVKELGDAGCVNPYVNGLQVERKVTGKLRRTFDALGRHYRENEKRIAAGLITEADPFLHRSSGTANVVHGVPEFREDTRVEIARLYQFFEPAQLACSCLEPHCSAWRCGYG